MLTAVMLMSAATWAQEGSVTVEEGSSQAFTIAVDAGYQIDDVVVDGASQGAVASHTFTNVTADHTIAASFSEIPPPPPVEYTLTVTTAGTGSGSVTVDPAGETPGPLLGWPSELPVVPWYGKKQP